MDAAIAILVVILLAIVLFWFLLLPATIAEKRGISGNELSTIKILCWCSLLVGVTWFIALILALVYQPHKWTTKEENKMDLEGLEKLFDLKEKGVITEEEYQKGRKKLIGS